MLVRYHNYHYRCNILPYLSGYFVRNDLGYMVIVSHLTFLCPSLLGHLPCPLLLPLLPVAVNASFNNLSILPHSTLCPLPHSSPVSQSDYSKVSSPCLLLPAHGLLLCAQEGGKRLALKPTGKADCFSRVPKALT